MSPEILIAMAIAAAAGAMRGFAGVGSGMLMAPFFLQLFGPLDTVALIIMMEVVVTGQLLPSVRREINWRIVAPMGLAAALLMPVGSWLLVSLDGQVVGRIVAGVVVVSSIVLMSGWRYHGSRPLGLTLAIGGVSGLLMALTSLGNPPVMIYLLSGRDAAATNRANFTGYFAITLVVLITLMGFSGLLKWSLLPTVAALLPGFIGFAWIGSRLFRKSSEALYRRVALLILLCAGLYGLAQ